MTPNPAKYQLSVILTVEDFHRAKAHCKKIGNIPLSTFVRSLLLKALEGDTSGQGKALAEAMNANIAYTNRG
jgi:hypothetical protein